jgi:hypothetical protein
MRHKAYVPDSIVMMITTAIAYYHAKAAKATFNNSYLYRYGRSGPSWLPAWPPEAGTGPS